MLHNGIEVYGVIYAYRNVLSEKHYIGQSTKLNKRKSKHKARANNQNFGTYFYNAVRKYGWENFEFKVVDTANSQEELDQKEISWILELNSHWTQWGYNLQWGGRRGFCSDDGRERIRKRMIEHNPMKGKTHTSESKEKMSIAHKGKKRSNESIKKQALNISFVYKITSPEGEEFIVKGLKDFANEHNLDRRALCRVANRQRTHHKGYKCKNLDLSIRKSKKKPVEKKNDRKNLNLGKRCSDETKKLMSGRTYKITCPEGNEYMVTTGLASFAKEHNLLARSLNRVANRQRTHHKGYKCERIEGPK